MKNVLFAAILGTSAMAQAEIRNFGGVQILDRQMETIEIKSYGDLENYHHWIVEHFGQDGYEIFEGHIELGNELTVSVYIDETDGGEGRGDCFVTVRERAGGSVSVGVGGRTVGEFSGEAHKDREYEIKGPCDKVKEIVDQIRREPTRHEPRREPRGGTGSWGEK